MVVNDNVAYLTPPWRSLVHREQARSYKSNTHQTVKTMEDTDLQALMARLELLITRVEQLKSQNGLLLAQEKTWREERAHLIEKNEIARRKVESMISRLKALEQDS
ncbi:hypothetical protein PS854_02861 [Pseudomonas fluorescens]|nr:hypothetical protein PS854_02861 [Pseudomonas fluorescens]